MPAPTLPSGDERGRDPVTSAAGQRSNREHHRADRERRHRRKPSAARPQRPGLQASRIESMNASVSAPQTISASKPVR
jgi:hypothetical protein